MYIARIVPIARRFQIEPDQDFIKLSRIGAMARRRGYLEKSEFVDICRWKSRRRIGLCESNSGSDVRAKTAAAISAQDERTQIEALVSLKGVAVPTGSAILAALDPSRFGVIDIRAWQFLHRARLLRLNRAGVNLSVRNWISYLSILRKVARKARTTPRLVEIALYWAHKQSQTGPLYAPTASNMPLQRTHCWLRFAPWQRAVECRR